MEITKTTADGAVEVVVKGRLDAYWADHLAAALEEVVRDGFHHVRLDMAGVAYMSSVGMRLLLRFHRQLQRINGSFAVTHPSEAVRTVLELAGLAALLGAAPAPTPAAGDRAQRREERAGTTFDLFELAPASTVTCRVSGQPELLQGCRFGEEHCRTVRVSEMTYGVGLGAFGSSFADCRSRFGEFLAVAGAAVYLPTDGTNVPDYLVATGGFVPELTALYALTCEGRCAHLVRFEAHDTVTLADLAASVLDLCGAEAAGMVILAEAAGLVGAALRRSPVNAAAAGAPFGHPRVREWLSFTPERAYARSLVLSVGVAARCDYAELSALLRPLGRAPLPAGHFHAAAFSYRPLQKGRIDLQRTVGALFDGETIQGVLHLLNDDREINGAGQSEFVRGACWVGPIGAIVAVRG